MKSRDEIIEEKMLRLLQQFEDKLSADILADNRDLVVHREWGVALENLCEQLYEFDVIVNSDSLEEIKELTREMRLPSKTWQFLER
jgi:hypothetical protein